MAKIIYPKKSYQIIGLCMQIHNILGPGLLEIVYKDALEYEFRFHDIPFNREKKYEVDYKGCILPHYFVADFVVYDDIILEIKANKKGLIQEHVAYTLNYMALAKSPLGLLINFGEQRLTHKRLVR